MGDIKYRAKAQPGIAVDPLHLTLAQGLDRFVASGLPDRTLAVRTRTVYLADLRHAFAYIEEVLGISRVTTVTRRHLERYLASLDQRGLKGSTQRRAATSLRVFFRFLEHEGYLVASPAEQLVPPPRDDQRPHVLTRIECRRLLAAARHHPRDLAILTLFLQTGLRRGELANLLRNDGELPLVSPPGKPIAGMLHLRRGNARTIPLTDSICRTLGTYLAHRSASGDPYLFLSKFQRGLGSWGVEDVVKTSLARVGIAHASTQSLRHTFAVQQVAQGVDLPTFQAILGHVHVATTRAYVALAREHMGTDR